MLNILILLALPFLFGALFFQLAHQKRRTPFRWAAAGMVTYFILWFLVGLVCLLIYEWFNLRFSYIRLYLPVVIVSLICIYIYSQLKELPDQRFQDENVLDDEFLT